MTPTSEFTVRSREDERRASAIVAELLAALDSAVTELGTPKDLSTGLVDGLRWNLGRLLAGQEISEPKR
ncbi:hypothetical protein ACX9R5_05610 [Rathayibacter sp. CAU 1779]